MGRSFGAVQNLGRSFGAVQVAVIAPVEPGWSGDLEYRYHGFFPQRRTRSTLRLTRRRGGFLFVPPATHVWGVELAPRPGGRTKAPGFRRRARGIEFLFSPTHIPGSQTWGPEFIRWERSFTYSHRAVGARYRNPDRVTALALPKQFIACTTFTGDGSTNTFALVFPYLHRDHL